VYLEDHQEAESVSTTALPCTTEHQNRLLLTAYTLFNTTNTKNHTSVFIKSSYANVSLTAKPLFHPYDAVKLESLEQPLNILKFI